MGRRQTATRERILKAAFERFSRYGFRRTSMEDIAGEAGVSRAALYLQFANKEEIFRSLSQELHETSLQKAAAALSDDAPLAARLQAAAEAKSARFVEIAYGSPHGSELLDESNRICGEMSAETQKRFVDQLTRCFRRAAHTGEVDLPSAGVSAPEAADLFARSVAGLKGSGVTPELWRKRLAALVRVFVAGLGGAAVESRAGKRRSA
jgi:AcrR family transcriptional regulator